jgi:phosphoribosylformylglycinamidine synthase
VAFALCPAGAAQVISSEFKRPGHLVLMVPLPRDEEEMPVFAALRRNYDVVLRWIREGKVASARSIRIGGLADAISKMCFGNGIGFEFEVPIPARALFSPDYGSLVLEIADEVDFGDLSQELQIRLLGKTSSAPAIRVNGIEIPLSRALKSWMNPLEKIFPSRAVEPPGKPRVCSYAHPNRNKPRLRLAQPRVFLPVFPGTNCEVDSARAFHRAGAIVDLQVLRNLSATDIDESMDAFVRGIDQAQIVMLPGGFSAGDEPEGSGKFIGAVFRNPRIKEAVTRFLQQRDGLMLGICNGFQALIKLGLVPYGEIRDLGAEDPTLTFNTIGRHVSCMVQTRVASTLSPWLSKRKVGDLHTIAISHGEGRFVANPGVLENLRRNGQIATQYVDLEGNPSYDSRYNPNGSVEAIEGITSPDGRVLGKMGHSERIGTFVAKNVPGEKDQQIFEAGVEYFS